MAIRPFGYVDNARLMEETAGEIELILIDSALERPLEESYKFEIEKDRVRVFPVSSPKFSFYIPSTIPLTPQTLAFIGLYTGDGDKTGNIGFSQREMHINRFAYLMMTEIFGDNSSITWNILEDVKRFQSKTMRKFLTKYKVKLKIGKTDYPNPDLLKQEEDFSVRTNSCSFRDHYTDHAIEYEDARGERHGLKFKAKISDTGSKADIISTEEGCNRFIKRYGFEAFIRALAENIAQILFLKDEFLQKARESGFEDKEINLDHISAYITKGARAPGKSSIVYMQKLSGSAKILPIWMKIIYSCLKAIIYEEKVPWVVWRNSDWPTLLRLDAYKYLRKYVRWATSRGYDRYEVSSITDEKLEITKSPRSKATINAYLPITPLIMLLCGFYLAEGDTKKESLFKFREEPARRLVVGMTTSEHRVFKTFLAVLVSLGQDLVQSWKIKVGERYAPETEALASKLGVTLMRGGKIGQGYVRTFEIHQALLEWAMKEFPFMSEFKDRFKDVEITGAGIPRLHLRCNSAINEYFLSLIVDLVFNLDDLIEDKCLSSPKVV